MEDLSVSHKTSDMAALDNTLPAQTNFSPRLYGIAILVAGIIITGIWLISRFTSLDLARDMQTWQEKLNLIAESRTDEVNHYVSEHFKELRTLADNPSLSLYLSELQAIPADAKPTTAGEPAQKAYLRNLLLFTADRAGYTSENNLATIRANVKEESKSGLAVINNNNDVVVSTSMQGATRDLIIEHAKK
jgi:hypothetical protein